MYLKTDMARLQVCMISFFLLSELWDLPTGASCKMVVQWDGASCKTVMKPFASMPRLTVIFYPFFLSLRLLAICLLCRRPPPSFSDPLT